MNNECWRVVPEWENYEISDKGSIRRTKDKIIRTPYITTTGYSYIALRKPSKEKKALGIHRLVAMAFIGGEPFKGAQVAHLDGDKLNNIASNLKWVDRFENAYHKIIHGRSNRGERNRACKLNRGKVLKIRELNKLGLSREEIAGIFDISVYTIRDIIRKRSWYWLDDNGQEVIEK